MQQTQQSVNPHSASQLQSVVCCHSKFKHHNFHQLHNNNNNNKSNPLPSNRRHRSNGDCLEGKRENYHVCFVQYCAQQLCTLQCTHMNRPNSSLHWVLSHWAHFTVLTYRASYASAVLGVVILSVRLSVTRVLCD